MRPIIYILISCFLAFGPVNAESFLKWKAHNAVGLLEYVLSGPINLHFNPVHPTRSSLVYSLRNEASGVRATTEKSNDLAAWQSVMSAANNGFLRVRIDNCEQFGCWSDEIDDRTGSLEAIIDWSPCCISTHAGIAVSPIAGSDMGAGGTLEADGVNFQNATVSAASGYMSRCILPSGVLVYFTDRGGNASY